jgi:hypothetical protein
METEMLPIYQVFRTVQLCFIPDEVRALHSTGIAVVRQRTGFPADNLV